jgi:hypothetical protein
MTASSPAWSRLPGYLVPLALVAAVVVGCAQPPINRPPESLIGKPWRNADGSPPSQDGDTIAVTGLAEVLAGKPPPLAPGKPLNVLVMSGGGKYGAFTSGILVGWTASGDRPTFDVATGISSGAIIATLAFLGPKYDQMMAQYFTTLQRSDVYKMQILRGLFTHSAVLTAEPLARILDRAIDAEFMCDLQAAYAEGRRLYVGTGEILTNRVAVWDITSIAASGRPDARELIVKVLTAACTPPGLGQAIEITVEVNGCRYTELHTDAGNMLQAFVRTPSGVPAGTNFWILSAGKYYRDPLPGDPKIINVAAAGVSNSLYALFRSDLVKLYALCAATRSNFRLIALPQDFKVTASAFAFDPEELVRLYWVGYQMTTGGAQWRTAPPDTLPGEATPPRTGTSFVWP